MANYKITVDEAVALSNGELNKDDVYSLIQANEVPGCIYIKDQEKERGKYLIIKPHWLNFLAGKSYKKIKTSNSTDQSLLDV
ncbi:peptidylprolyl isomerase [Fusobacterium pseudoperiodonticum]|uniref:peptidylprolyl isomerase n=1 Tax=Fusobacterium pseudoperiodonticum TaxID=2663009 RepID=UPI0030CC26CC